MSITFIAVLLLVHLLTELSIAADDVVIVVPCGHVTTYNLTGSRNNTPWTRIILQNCTSSAGTVVNVRPAATSQLLCNVSIVVEDSRWVAIFVKGTPTADLSGVSIFVRNVSDVCHESIRTTSVCTAAESNQCLGLVRIAVFRNTTDLSIIMADLHATRNMSLIFLQNISTAANVTIGVRNATVYMSSSSALQISDVSDMITHNVVSLFLIRYTLIPSFSPGDAHAVAAWSNVPVVLHMQVFFDSVTVEGSPWDGPAAVVRLQDVGVCRGCSVHIHNADLVLPYAVDSIDTFVAGLIVLNTAVTNCAFHIDAARGTNDATAVAMQIANANVDGLELSVVNCNQVVTSLVGDTETDVSGLVLLLQNVTNSGSPKLHNSLLHANILSLIDVREIKTLANTSISIQDIELSNSTTSTLAAASIQSIGRIAGLTLTAVNVAVVNASTLCAAYISGISELVVNSSVSLQSIVHSTPSGVDGTPVYITDVASMQAISLSIRNATCIAGPLDRITLLTLISVTHCVACDFIVANVRMVAAVACGMLVHSSTFADGCTSTIVNFNTSNGIVVQVQYSTIANTTISMDGTTLNSVTTLPSGSVGLLGFFTCIINTLVVIVQRSSISTIGATPFGLLAASSNSTGVVVTVVNFQMSSNGAIVRVQFSAITAMLVFIDGATLNSLSALATTLFVGLVGVTSSTINASSVTIQRSSMTVRNTAASGLMLIDTDIGGLQVRIENVTTTVNNGFLLRILRSETSTLFVAIDNISCSSQLACILLDSLRQTSRSITLNVTRSNFSGTYPIYITSSNVTQLSLTISSSTINIDGNESMSDNQYNALFFTNGSLTASTISVNSTSSKCSGAVTPRAAQVVRFFSFLLLSSTNVSIVVDTVENSGGIAAVWSCVVDGASSIDIRVLSNITVVPSFILSLAYVYLTTISNSSSVQIRLPQGISMTSGTSRFAPLFIDSVTLLGASRLLIAPVAAAASLTWRVNCVVSLVNTIALSNSSVSIQGLTVATNSSTLAIIATCFFSASQLVVRAMRLASSSAVNTLGLAFNTVYAIGGASVGLQLSCGISRCVTVYDNTFTAQSSLLLDLVRTPGYTSAATITYSGFDDSLVHVSVPAIATPTLSAALAVSIVGSYFSLTSPSAPQQQLLVITPPGGTDSLRMTLYLAATDFVALWAAPPLAQPLGESGQSLALLNASVPTSSSLAIVTSQITVIGLAAFVTAPPALLSVTGFVSSVSVTCSWWGRHSFTGKLASLHVALQGTFLRRNPHSALDAATTVTAVAASRTCGVAYDNGRADGSWTVSSSPSLTNPYASTTSSSSCSSGSASRSTGRTLPKLPNRLETNMPTLGFSLSALPQKLTTTVPHIATTRSAASSTSHSKVHSRTSTRSATAVKTHLSVSFSSFPAHSVSFRQPPLIVLAANGNGAVARTAIAAAAGILVGDLLGSAAGASTLVRTSFSQQLAQCAAHSSGNDAATAVISGNDDANLFQIPVGDASSPGYGYRGSLVSAAVLVGGSALLLAGISCCLHRDKLRSQNAEVTLRGEIAAASGEPGWWLAGPCAIAVAPMLSSGISLASVSPWVGSADGVLVVLGLAIACALVAWCCKALLRPPHGGWFTATCRSAARPLHAASSTAAPAKMLRWCLAGALSWSTESRAHHGSHHFIHAYGALFTGMRPQCHWWFLVDLAASVTVGLIAALPALFVHRDDAADVVPRVCAGALHASTAVQVLFLVAHVVLSPVAVRWEAAASLLLAAIGAVSALLASLEASGVSGLDATSDALGDTQLAVSVFVILAGLVEDIFALLTSQPSRRGRRSAVAMHQQYGHVPRRRQYRAGALNLDECDTTPGSQGPPIRYQLAEATLRKLILIITNSRYPDESPFL